MLSETILYYLNVPNLLLSLVGLAWLLGMSAASRDVVAYRGWLLFWIGTATYYGVWTAYHAGWVQPVNWRWWLPESGLYTANASLLVAYVLSDAALERWRRWIAVAATLAVVALAVLGDASMTTRWCNQLLTAVAVLPWAFRLRSLDFNRSIVLALYGLIQLPLGQFAPPAAQRGNGWELFLATTFVLYAVGKVPLIYAIQGVVQKHELDELERYRSAASERPPVDVRSFDVFIAYAFEDLAQARHLAAALRARDTRAFLASDSLSSMIGKLEWSTLIDQVLDEVQGLAVIVSRNSLASQWVDRERRRVELRILRGQGAVIVPVCIEDTSLEDLRHGLELYSAIAVGDPADYGSVADAIIQRLENLRAKPTTPVVA